jgi:sugar (pentulose or hexulose) kinase
LGAAIDAAVGAGVHPNFDAAIAAMTHIGEQFQPDPAAHMLYDQLFHQLYRKLYDRLQPLYEQLYRLTNKTHKSM